MLSVFLGFTDSDLPVWYLQTPVILKLGM